MFNYCNKKQNSYKGVSFPYNNINQSVKISLVDKYNIQTVGTNPSMSFKTSPIGRDIVFPNAG